MIEFKNVYKTYPNGFTALKDINLRIEQGEFVAIIGLSGAGKSTILRCINRMHDVTKGTLTVDGVDVNTLKGAELRRFRRKVGMIFQSFNLVNRSTAIKNVLTADVPDMDFFRVLFGIFSKEQKMRALESLDKVGILDKAYTRCDQLSGGQQQRVALARTLNQNPKIILADEPVASLDPITARQVMQDFVRINKNYNISILLNIHHIDLALQYCDRVIGVRAGEIVFDGPAATITQEQIDYVYNGTKAQKMQALEALDKVGILDKAYTRCDQLSGGQQQRVSLARTLNQQPTIILADEPVAALDPVTANQVMSDFKRINEDMNITVLINIHHVDLALKYCNRVIGIRAGEVVYDGPTAEVTQEILDQIYNGAAIPTSEK